MDIQAIIGQVTEALGSAPEKVQDILADPKAAIEEITGQTIGEGDIAEIVSGLNLGDIAQNIDLGSIAENVLENSPLGGIADSLGGLFGKK